MTLSVNMVEAALANLRAMLDSDGYDLQTVAASAEGITLRIGANEGSCAECLVPQSMMMLYVRDALKDLPNGHAVPVELHYPETAG